MSEGSNSEWGALVTADSELADAWDTFDRLPDAGENEALDAFCERKNIDIPSLVRLGARLAEPGVLTFAYDRGIKFRDIVTGRRWNYLGSEFKRMKVVPSQTEGATQCIVAEGETDAARLTIMYPEADVAVMPAGAETFTEDFASQLTGYGLVLVGLDADAAGERGAAKIIAALPHAMRFAPPANDWCEAGEVPPLPVELDRPVEEQVLVPAGAMLQLEVPDITSWYEQALLPIGGLLVLHGPQKSFKSFMALDMLAALAQGQDWACFEPTEEACRVAVMQYEIPWPYYKERVQRLRENAREPERFDENFITWTPMRRPLPVVGNKKYEAYVLQQLVAAEIQVVLVDPVRRAGRGLDMNSEQDTAKLLGFFEKVNDQGITVVTVHHDNKENSRRGGGDTNAMTGSGSFAGDPDTIVDVTLPQGDNARTSNRRNLYFTTRNAAVPQPRGVEMQENGVTLYNPEPYGGYDDDDAPSI